MSGTMSIDGFFDPFWPGPEPRHNLGDDTFGEVDDAASEAAADLTRSPQSRQTDGVSLPT